MAAKPLSTAPYAAVYALDSQMALEAGPIAHWDWKSAGVQGPILLLVFPQMLREVDSKKRDGRLAERARAFNRLVEPCTLSPMPFRLSENPRVDIALSATRRIEWTAFDDLDPAAGDDKLVAEVLHADIDAPDRIVMLSYDTRPRAIAVRHGLSAFKPPEDWMLPPEPSPAEKDVARLKQKVSELSATHPKFVVTVADADPPPAVLFKVEAIEERLQPYVSQFWLEQNPPAGGGMMDFDVGYDGRYDRYEARIRAFPKKIHKALQTFHGQRRLVLGLENKGHVAADHVEIVVKVSNGRLYHRLQVRDVLPPKPPKRQPSGVIFNVPHVLERLPARPSRIDVAFDEDTDGAAEIRFSCEDFRHGRLWEGELFVEPDLNAASPVRIEVRVTAANLTGDERAVLMLPFAVENRKVEDLLDTSAMTLKESSPHASWIRGLDKDEFDDRVDVGDRDY